MIAVKGQPQIDVYFSAEDEINVDITRISNNAVVCNSVCIPLEHAVAVADAIKRIYEEVDL